MQVNVKATSFFFSKCPKYAIKKDCWVMFQLDEKTCPIRLVMPAVCAQVPNVRAVWAVDALFLQYRAFLLDTCPELYIF